MLNDIFLFISPSLEFNKKMMKFTLGFVPSIPFLTRNGVIPRRVSTKVSPGGKSKVRVNPLNWRQCLRATITKRTTMNSQMLNIPLYKTATGQRTFYFRTAKLWNSLDSSLKLKPTQDFKRSLKRSVVSNLLMT